MSKTNTGAGRSREVGGEAQGASRLEIEVRREVYSEHSTIGRLFVNGQFECYTLEDRVRRPGVKVAGCTAIPAGTYQLVINRSQRLQRLMPQLLEVPGFEGVRIHAGNTDADTEGCILVGLSRRSDRIAQSRAAFARLFAKLKAKQAGAEVWITIVDMQPSEVVPEISAVAVVRAKIAACRSNAGMSDVTAPSASRRCVAS